MRYNFYQPSKLISICRVFASLLMLFSSPVSAQDAPSGDDPTLLLTKERTFGLLIHTRGWGFNFRKGNHLTGTLKRVMDFEFATLRHPKEIRSQNQLVDGSRSYFFGKLNSVGLLRIGYGLQKEKFGKFLQGAVEVRFVGFLGGVIALAKPVFLEVNYRNTTLPQTERYDPDKHTQDNIVGRSPFLRGIGKTTPYFGAYGKFGLNFEYARGETSIKSIETGIVLDFVPSGIPMMAFNTDEILIPTFYVNIAIGKKWN
jgi:hypothetical protein